MTASQTIDSGVATLPGGAGGWPFATLREALGDLRDAARVVRIDLHGSAPLSWTARELRWLEHYPLPVIAVLRGETGAQALAVALACDIRVAADDAVLNLPDAPPDRLATLLGGRETVAGASSLTAAEALAAGLVSLVTPAAELDAAAARLAATVASRGPIATQLAKEAIWRGLEMPFEQALRFETDLTLLLQTTNDRAEGVAAFLEKRAPQFTGK